MYCSCGCGEKTKPAIQTDRRKGVRKGEPQKWILGHRSRMSRVLRARPRLAATKSPTNLEIAWAAGLYEGEGTAVSTAGRYHNGTAASVSQKDQWVLYRLQELFGGSVRQHPEHTFPSQHRAAISTWRLSGQRAHGFLMTIFPFLSPRRKAQILRADHFQKRVF